MKRIRVATPEVEDAMQAYSLRGPANSRNNGQPHAFDLHVILFAALSPLCAVCGFMLAEIAGFAPF